MTSDDDPLYSRLTRLIQKTASAGALKRGGWWDGDVAGERQALDDMEAGRSFWLSAHHQALRGIKALEASDRVTAQTLAWAATDFYIAALETRIRPSDMTVLGRPSERRGRPKKK